MSAPSSLYPYRPPVLVVILSDFGRRAALRCALDITDTERGEIQSRLGPGALFADEYRRIVLSLIGNVAFIKEPWLARYAERQERLDTRMMVVRECDSLKVDTNLIRSNAKRASLEDLEWRMWLQESLP